IHCDDKTALTELLSDWEVVSLLIACIIVAVFFVAKFLLHFLQQVLHLVEGFATDPEKVIFQTFSVDWHYFFIFQHKWIGFYVGFYILVGISVLKLLYNVKMNYQSINKGQHGTNEFEKVE